MKKTALVIALTAVTAAFFVSAAWTAASIEDQLTRLSQLSITAFQCTQRSPNTTDAARLHLVAVEAGRKYVELARREKKALDRVRDHIPGIYLQLDGPSADFIVGRADGYGQARFVFDEIEAVRTGAATFQTFKPSTYKILDCANLKLQ